MASPQVENGNTRLANELLEALAKTNLSPYETRILLAVVRKTYGWAKKADRISHSQFQELTDLKRQHVSRALNSLIARGIVLKKGDGHRIYYGVQKNYDKWLASLGQAHSSPLLVTKASPLPVTLEPENEASVTPAGDEIETSPSQVSSSPLPVTKSSPSGGRTKERKTLQKKEDIYSIFEYWNGMKIIVHEILTAQMSTAIANALNTYGIVLVMQAIGNYNTIVKGDYDWSYRWTLLEFLTRGGGNNIERFKDMSVLRENYGRKRGTETQGRPRVSSGQLEEARHPEGYTRPPAFIE